MVYKVSYEYGISTHFLHNKKGFEKKGNKVWLFRRWACLKVDSTVKGRHENKCFQNALKFPANKNFPILLHREFSNKFPEIWKFPTNPHARKGHLMYKHVTGRYTTLVVELGSVSFNNCFMLLIPSMSYYKEFPSGIDWLVILIFQDQQILVNK